MPQRLAIEIAATEFRALLASAFESRIRIEKFITVPFGPDEPDGAHDGAETRPVNPEQAIAEALAEHGMARADAIAVVGRADVELRLLNIPRVPDAELPDVVRFQAVQELAGIGEKTPLDFLPLGDAEPGGTTQRILAAALRPGVIKRLEKIAAGAKSTLLRIVLRPTATASLVLRAKGDLSAGCCLLVDIRGRHVDFAALREGQVVFLRHMILPGDSADSDEARESLAAEIRRTRAVVANQERIAAVEPVVLVGNPPEGAKLQEFLAAETKSTVIAIDPLASLVIEDRGGVLSPADRIACAAMLGALADESADRSPGFDFLNPRRPPEPPSRRNTYVLAGLLAACVVLAVMGLNWLQGARIQADIRRLQEEAKSLQPEVEKGDKIVADAGEVGQWLDGEVVWIDEIAWLSQRFPGAEDAMLTSLTVSSNAQRREILIGGFARDVDALSALDESLRDASHEVVGKTRNENRSERGYGIQFRSSVQITPPKK